MDEGGTLLDRYRQKWPQVGAVLGMALGGASLLANRKKLTNLRALAVMNSMTMAAHQVEEYVEPGYFAGQVNRGIFKSDHPRNWPYNMQSAMLANGVFTAIYIPPMVFPKVKWLGLPTAALGLGQVVAHWVIVPRLVHARYSPGGLNAICLQAPLSITYIHAVRAQGPIERSDLVKSAAVMATFVAAVATVNIACASKDSPYAWSAKQMGPYDTEGPEAGGSTTEPQASV